MSERSPEQKLQAILNGLRNTKHDPTHATFQNLAAGPLEDLLGSHGAELIEQVEVEARRNPSFNLLLGGVWQNEISNEVWARIQAARLKVW
jgi:hypothetical protein